MSTSLLWLLDGIAAVPANDAQVADLAIDSREARPGGLFLALKGRRSHGLEFAAEAVARGACAVLWEPAPGVEPPSFSEPVFTAPVTGLSGLVGRIADRFFQWPSSHLRVVGITGTNGKTTCAYLVAQCLTRLGQISGYIGTIGWGRLDALEAPTHTTPDAVSLHRMLAQLRTQGARTVAMEVSSHALDQGRVDGVRFHAAAFTNLSRDHLDYHATMQAYGEAKARLFATPDLEHMIVNVGDEFGRELAMKLADCGALTIVSVGGSSDAWLAEQSMRADRVVLDLKGISMDIDGSFGKLHLSTKLLGRFNAENALVVLACLVSLGVPLQEAAPALAECHAPPGRMEVIQSNAAGKPTAVIDYAHTPDALAKALAALREHCPGTLWCVFGCGGDRDPGKRPMMGAVADELADRIIVTDDNPRSENPGEIVRAITAGITAHRARIVHDRGAAIAEALNAAGGSDVVLIAGKGHEDYQIYGASRRSFSDRVEALKILSTAA
jgi:UDP-N-acetylmuramoyl-L-alanyl-D-glutamate--2,6-diaminopimelate ligase